MPLPNSMTSSCFAYGNRSTSSNMNHAKQLILQQQQQHGTDTMRKSDRYRDWYLMTSKSGSSLSTCHSYGDSSTFETGYGKVESDTAAAADKKQMTIRSEQITTKTNNISSSRRRRSPNSISFSLEEHAPEMDEVREHDDVELSGRSNDQDRQVIHQERDVRMVLPSSSSSSCGSMLLLTLDDVCRIHLRHQNYDKQLYHHDRLDHHDDDDICSWSIQRCDAFEES